jgi:hypothetical protein
MLHDVAHRAIRPTWRVHLDDQALGSVLLCKLYASLQVLGDKGIDNTVDGGYIHVRRTLGQGATIARK